MVNCQMVYDFDEIIPRKGTDAIKIDRVKNECGTDDLLPMWVADMDFRTPPFIFDAIRKRLEQGILGYTCQNPPYYESICRSFRSPSIIPSALCPRHASEWWYKARFVARKPLSQWTSRHFVATSKAAR